MSPFLSAITSIGHPGGALQSLIGQPLRAYDESQNVNDFEQKVKELQQNGVPGGQALVQAFTQNPQFFHTLPSDYLANSNNLLQLITPKPASPQVFHSRTGDIVSAVPDQNAMGGYKITPLGNSYDPANPLDVAAAREKDPNAIRVIQEFEQRFGPLSDEEKKRIIGAIHDPSTSVKVDVAAPDVSGVLNYVDKANRASDEKNISSLTTIDQNLAALDKIVRDPSAKWFFGAGHEVAEPAAAAAALFNYNKIFGPLGGPQIADMGAARSQAAETLSSAANYLRTQSNYGRLLKEDQNNIEAMIGDPNHFLTSPQLMQGAIASLRRGVQREQLHYGIQATLGGVAKPEGTNAAALETLAQQILDNQGVKPGTATPAQRDAARKQAAEKLGLKNLALPAEQPMTPGPAGPTPTTVPSGPAKKPTASAPAPAKAPEKVATQGGIPTFKDPNDPEFQKLPRGSAFYTGEVDKAGTKIIRYKK